MKTLVYINSFGVPAHYRNELKRIYPDGLDELGYFSLRLLDNDPIVHKVREWLHGKGYSPWSGLEDLKNGSEYPLQLLRVYEPSDFEDVEYLEIHGDLLDSVACEGRDDQGSLLLEQPTLHRAERTTLDFCSATMSEVLVCEQTKLVLESQHLAGMKMKATTLVKGMGARPGRYKPVSWDSRVKSGRWWELTSELTMPRLSDSMMMLNRRNEPVRATETDTPCLPREGFYNRVELHYRRKDLEGLPSFDVALTFENFGTAHRVRRSTIVSKRFYELCVGKGLKGRWAPVRLDPPLP